MEPTLCDLLRVVGHAGTTQRNIGEQAAAEIARLQAALKSLVGMFDEKGCYIFVEDVEQDEVIEARKILNEQLAREEK